MPQPLKPLCFTQIERIQFSHFQPTSLLGNKNWAPQYKDVEVAKFREQNWLNRLQMVQFECPRHSNPCVSLRLGEFHFPIFSLPLSGVIRIGLPNKDVEVAKFREQNWLNTLQMVQFECPSHLNPCVSLFDWENSIFPLSAFLSGVIRIGLPSIKMKKLQNLGNTIGLTGCKWFSLNAPGARVMHLLMAFTFEAYYSYPPSERRLAPRRACRAY